MKPSFSTNSTAPKRSSGPCNYPHLWPAQGRLELRLRAMLEPDNITRSGGASKGSAQKDTLLRKASKALIRQGKMRVIGSPETGRGAAFAEGGLHVGGARDAVRGRRGGVRRDGDPRAAAGGERGTALIGPARKLARTGRFSPRPSRTRPCAEHRGP